MPHAPLASVKPNMGRLLKKNECARALDVIGQVMELSKRQSVLRLCLVTTSKELKSQMEAYVMLGASKNMVE